MKIRTTRTSFVAVVIFVASASASASSIRADTKRFFSLSSNTEDIDETTEDTSSELTKRSLPWKFFKRNKDSAEIPEEANSDDNSDSETKKKKLLPSAEKEDEKKRRFQFQIFPRERVSDKKDSADQDISDNETSEDDGNEEKKSDVNSSKKNKSSKVNVDKSNNTTNYEESSSSSSSLSSSDKDENDSDESDSQSGEDEIEIDEDNKENKFDNDKKNSTNNLTPAQQYRKQILIRQQQLAQPLGGTGTSLYRSVPLQQQGTPFYPGAPNPSTLPTSQGQIMAAAALVNLLSLASRFFFIKWIINKLAFESELASPVQHFMWECLNDKFVKDDQIWNRVLFRKPHSVNGSQSKWKKVVTAMGPTHSDQNQKSDRSKKKTKKHIESNNSKEASSYDEVVQVERDQKIKPSPETSKTVVVMDFSTMNVLDPDFLRFADVVTFLVGANTPRKQFFGKKPEVLLILQSPGGEVTSFAFAAAQIHRLRSCGWNVTVSVDRIAASGGYMIASQATQILASPFAMVGSIGVITETLNFHEILKKYGIKSLVLKAGDMKNPISQLGEVTKEDIKNTQDDLEEIHQSFIDLCRLQRPILNPSVCNGRILSGEKALKNGMIDRILTSDEYILEKISEGDLVMKLHLVSGRTEHHIVARALELLPHLSRKIKSVFPATWPAAGIRNTMMNMNGNENLANKMMQLIGLACMVRQALARSDFRFSKAR